MIKISLLVKRYADVDFEQIGFLFRRSLKIKQGIKKYLISRKIRGNQSTFFIVLEQKTKNNRRKIQKLVIQVMKFKKSQLSILIAFFGLFTSSLCLKAIDISSNATATSFKCALQEGFTHLIVRAYRSSGQIDRNCLGNLQRANRTGLTTDVYIFPCRGKSASEQGDEVIKLLQKVKQMIKTVWVDVQTFSVGKSSCFWSSYSPQSNCGFVKQMVGTIQKANFTVGIYSSFFNWQEVMGSDKSCTQFSHLPLWYARYNKKQNFDDYKPFGGWIKPYMKQYLGDQIFCGMIADLNWSPDFIN